MEQITNKNKGGIENNETIFFNGDDFFDSLYEGLRLAKKSIDVEVYIFEFDNLGNKLLDLCKEALQRGVKVRILVDGAGTPHWGGRKIRKLEKLGGETRVFHPFPWRLWQFNRSRVRFPILLKIFYLLWNMNSRNHRKICVIDESIVYIGSFNVSEDHICLNHNSKGWRDTGIRLSNVNIGELRRAIEAAWHNIPIQERIKQFFKHIQTNPTFRLNNNRHRRRILYKDLLNKMGRCKERIWITNAYFIPDNFLLKKLQEAAAIGVDVRILLPKESDVVFIPWASQAFYERLLRSGVRIFEYLPAILHAKTLILDDWMLIGSSNLNHRSLLHDLEVDVNIRSGESKRLLEAQFLADLELAKEIEIKNGPKLSFCKKLIGAFFLYLKYWI